MTQEESSKYKGNAIQTKTINKTHLNNINQAK